MSLLLVHFYFLNYFLKLILGFYTYQIQLNEEKLTMQTTNKNWLGSQEDRARGGVHPGKIKIHGANTQRQTTIRALYISAIFYTLSTSCCTLYTIYQGFLISDSWWCKSFFVFLFKYISRVINSFSVVAVFKIAQCRFHHISATLLASNMIFEIKKNHKIKHLCSHTVEASLNVSWLKPD